MDGGMKERKGGREEWCEEKREDGGGEKIKLFPIVIHD